MKITKEPTIKRLKSKCPVCGCEFEFSPNEAKWDIRNRESDLGRILDVIVYCNVKCPYCGTHLSNYEKVEGLDNDNTGTEREEAYS